MKAILTTFYGPTGSRGSRIKAAASDVVSVWINYDGMLDAEAAHRAAAHELCRRNGWPQDRLAGGRLPNGDFAWCFIPQEFKL